jgi:hypothetical protein
MLVKANHNTLERSTTMKTLAQLRKAGNTLVQTLMVTACLGLTLAMQATHNRDAMNSHYPVAAQST